MKDDVLDHLTRMSQKLRSGALSDDDIEHLDRMEASLSGLKERELQAIRAIARRNCELALSARKGVVAARRLLLDGDRRSGQVYDRDGSREGLGGATKTLNVNI